VLTKALQAKQPGQTVQLDRYRFFGNPGS